MDEQMKPIPANLSHFRNCVNRYKDLLNLNHWQIIVVVVDWADGQFRAKTIPHDIDCGAQQVRLCINDEWLYHPETSLFEIERTAFHECCEILFYKLVWFARNPELYKSDREIITELHSIIRTLENNILPKIKS
jgi:hypothetical protein